MHTRSLYELPFHYYYNYLRCFVDLFEFLLFAEHSLDLGNGVITCVERKLPQLEENNRDGYVCVCVYKMWWVFIYLFFPLKMESFFV